MISPDAKGLYHPKTESDITELIQYAVQNKLQMRVRGAAQSVSGAVFADAGDKNINMELDQLRSVQFDDATMQVTVGAGCNLGFDPYDPSQTSRMENSLFYLLNEHGWAIPNVPDAIHQTVAGFISTGSSGSSMMHSFDECIVAITLIDGTGKISTFKKSADLNDNFYAVGVAMGLLGVITSVTLQCIPAFNIIGNQSTTEAVNCAYDFLGSGNGKQSLQNFFSGTEFARMLWWPYRTVQRVITWQARTMQAADYNPQTTGTQQNFTPHPYKPVFRKVLGSTLPEEVLAAEGYKLIGSWPTWLNNVMGNWDKGPLVQGLVETLSPSLYPLMLNMFFPIDSEKKPAQQFNDNWLGSLPMDTVEFSTHLFDMCYTEVWVDINEAQNLISTFQNHYVSKGFSATWVYCVEVLTAKKSDFWMSPGYGRDSIRISIMWWNTNTRKPMDYYQQFWDLLQQKNIPFRLHWGKYLPPAKSNEGVDYLQKQYPKWNDFMNLRKQMDPNNIFLSSYWKTQLGL